MCQSASERHRRLTLTSGTLHDRAVKPADAMIMSTKTTHSVFLPESPMNWSSGVVGTTEGMGATWVGVAVGRGRIEVFFKISSNCSAIMMAVLNAAVGTGIDSSPVEWERCEREQEAEGYKEAEKPGSCFKRVMRRVRTVGHLC
jgi:hypothetical protein